MKWFSPPTSDESSDEATENFTKAQISLKAKPGRKKTQIYDNIYSKTYKKRQSYERKRDQIGAAGISTSKGKPLHSVPRHTIGHSISAINSKRGKPRKPFKPLAIARQLLEKAKDEKRHQLQKKEIKELTSSPVSRFGRTVKKKVLDYDDFTSCHGKRKLENAKMPPLKALKGEEGERQLIRPGWLALGVVYTLHFH